MSKQRMALATIYLCIGAVAQAEVKSKVVDYSQGDTPLQGFLAWDDAAKGKRPGILVVHEWWGHNQHARNQALRLAKEGYVGFALDMFGKGKVTTHPQEAKAFAADATKDPKVMHERFQAALEVLKKNPHVDATKIGAIGYCFGGGVVLSEARQGADLKAVATLHGSLRTEKPAKPGSVKGRLLVMTGVDDPMVTGAQVDAFKKEMTDAGAKFEVITYPGAKHAFTNPDADKAGVDGLAYNAEADKKSWADLSRMLKQVFGT